MLDFSDFPVLSELDDQSLQDLELELERLHLPGGQYLFHRGEQGDCLYLICSGRVHVLLEDEVVASLGRGEMVGEMALLSGEERSASVKAIRDSELLRIANSGFQRLIKKSSAAAGAIMRVLARIGTESDRSLDKGSHYIIFKHLSKPLFDRSSITICKGILTQVAFPNPLMHRG
jgi:CRP-like cAMP-binding protein